MLGRSFLTFTLDTGQKEKHWKEKRWDGYKEKNGIDGKVEKRKTGKWEDETDEKKRTEKRGDGTV